MKVGALVTILELKDDEGVQHRPPQHVPLWPVNPETSGALPPSLVQKVTYTSFPLSVLEPLMYVGSLTQVRYMGFVYISMS